MRSVGAALVKLIATATSGLVSFTTNVIRPVKVTCEFSPVQEGTGDPSPDNVRPISGWTGCKITHTHGNLIDPSTSTFGRYINNSGEYVASAINPKLNASDFFRVVPGHQYTMHMENQNGETNKIVFCWYSSDKRFLRRGVLTPVKNHPYYTLTQVAPSDAYYGRANYFTSNLQTALIYDSTELIEAPDSQVVALPITFTDPSTGDPMTVYGGTVTLNEDGSADLVADTTIVDLGDYPFSQYGSSNHCWTGQIPPMSYVINNNPVVCCEEYKVLEPQSILSNGKNLAIWAYNATKNARVIIRNDSFIGESGTYDIAALNNSLSGVHMCCRMKTPITYHFDNIGQLQSFLGTNNIWHNMNGDITVEYWNKQ